MLHPSYRDLMKVVNSEVEIGDEPIVNSRYSIVLATAKRARQLVSGAEPLVLPRGRKPLSVAVDELYQGELKILGEDEDAAAEAERDGLGYEEASRQPYAAELEAYDEAEEEEGEESEDEQDSRSIYGSSYDDYDEYASDDDLESEDSEEEDQELEEE